jgi:hypothetical protein
LSAIAESHSRLPNSRVEPYMAKPAFLVNSDQAD